MDSDDEKQQHNTETTNITIQSGNRNRGYTAGVESTYDDIQEVEHRDTPQYFHIKSTTNIIVSHSQRGNPLLTFIRNAIYEFADIVPSYLIGKVCAVIFISLKFHRLHPTYLSKSIDSLGRRYRPRILLALVDLSDYESVLRDITLTSIRGKMTVILSWSPQESARILETLMAFVNKPADLIRGRIEGDHRTRVTSVLTCVKAVNKTDVTTLMAAFPTLAAIMKADSKELRKMFGIGERKIRCLEAAFKTPFFGDSGGQY